MKLADVVVAGGRTARCLVHRAGAGVRIHLGSGHLGNLVGLGRATDSLLLQFFLLLGVVSLRTALEDSEAARACDCSALSVASMCRHQVLCRLVEYASSALDQLHPGDRSGERP